jgi:hypothetical protein
LEQDRHPCVGLGVGVSVGHAGIPVGAGVGAGAGAGAGVTALIIAVMAAGVSCFFIGVCKFAPNPPPLLYICHVNVMQYWPSFIVD